MNSCISKKKPLTHDDGVVINGVKWATRNVDKPGTFAAKPEDPGMFYQWNRKKGWTVTGNDVMNWDSSDAAGDIWEKANDPCPKGWRVPTEEEAEALRYSQDVTDEWATINGINGKKFTDQITGDTIFLPAVGFRDNLDGSLGKYDYGSYWAATVNERRYPYYITFEKGSYSTNLWSTNGRFGFSVRCVTTDPFFSTVGQEIEVNGINYKLKPKRTGKGMVAYITENRQSTEPNVVIPNKVLYNGKSFAVVGIEREAFWLKQDLTSIKLPKSLKKIDNYAFSDCDNLTSISIPNSVIYIGVGAFAGDNLQSIFVSKNNRRYMVKDGVLFSKNQDTLFCYPAQKTDTLYNIPLGVKEIMPDAFAYCAHVKSVTIPVSMSKIGEKAFRKCYSLERLTIPSNIKSIGAGAFSDCRNLKHIDLPNTIERIETFTFEKCESLTSLHLPNSITKIGSHAFYKSGIVSIEIPNSAVEIGIHAFSHCSHLKSIKIPNTLREIGTCAFSDCELLENIVLPDSLQNIAYGLFFRSGIKKLIIPKGVKSICSDFLNELYGCWFLPENIEEVTVFWDNPSDISIGFDGLVWSHKIIERGKNSILRVPKGTKELYEAAEYWSDFKEIVEYDVE